MAEPGDKHKDPLLRVRELPTALLSERAELHRRATPGHGDVRIAESVRPI